MGESNCNWKRKLNLNKDLMIAAQSIYQGKISIEKYFNMKQYEKCV